MILDWSHESPAGIERLWDQLLTWTEWAARVYPTLRAALKPCYIEHPEVLRELVACMTWWENIYRPAMGSGELNGYAAVEWHEHLPGLVQRLHSALKPCTSDQCWRQTEYGSCQGSRLPRAAPATDVPDHIRLWEAPHE